MDSMIGMMIVRAEGNTRGFQVFADCTCYISVATVSNLARFGTYDSHPIEVLPW